MQNFKTFYAHMQNQEPPPEAHRFHVNAQARIKLGGNRSEDCVVTRITEDIITVEYGTEAKRKGVTSHFSRRTLFLATVSPDEQQILSDFPDRKLCPLTLYYLPEYESALWGHAQVVVEPSTDPIHPWQVTLQARANKDATKDDYVVELMAGTFTDLKSARATATKVVKREYPRLEKQLQALPPPSTVKVG